MADTADTAASMVGRIRRVIFEEYNDVDVRFTNDEIFERLRRDGSIDPAWTIDDMEPYISELCDSGLVRNIAQNFTTIWLKLFDLIEERHCGTCGNDMLLGRLEEQVCGNPSCGAAL